MNSPRPSLLLRLAWLCLLLMLAVTTASAWLRLAQAPAGCEGWPQCRHVQVASAPAADAGWMGTQPTVDTVRSVHRMSGSGVLLLALALLPLCWRQRSRHPGAWRFALGLVLGALGLALLGILAGGSRAPGVLLGNMLGGLLMLALAWRLVLALRADAAAPPALGPWPLLIALVWLLQAGLGLISGTGRGTLYPLLHVMLGLGAVGLGWGLAYALRQRGLGRTGLALLCIATWQLALGFSGALTDAAASVVLLHNMGAALGLALLAGLIRRPA